MRFVFQVFALGLFSALALQPAAVIAQDGSTVGTETLSEQAASFRRIIAVLEEESKRWKLRLLMPGPRVTKSKCNWRLYRMS